MIDAINKWPDNVVPYEIATAGQPNSWHSKTSAAAQASAERLIAQSIAHVHAETNVRFRKKVDWNFRTGDASQGDRCYVRFEQAEVDGCTSMIGRVGGGMQTINMGWCWDDTKLGHAQAVTHEIGHALGLTHEHQRLDRDDFIDMQFYDASWEKLNNYRLIPDVR